MRFSSPAAPRGVGGCAYGNAEHVILEGLSDTVKDIISLCFYFYEIYGNVKRVTK